MKSPYKDVRILLLLLSGTPMILWGSGLSCLWWFWGKMLGVTIGVVLIMGGFWFTTMLPKVGNLCFQIAFSSAVSKVKYDDWIGVGLELTGNHHKLHLLPHSLGVLIRSIDGVRLVKLDGKETFLPLTATRFANAAKGNISLAITATNLEGIDLIGYVLSPVYKGSQLETAGYADKRLEWFLNWVSKTADIKHPPSCGA